ncbi:MAG: hypothetical protein J7M40_11185 [Planctomycetes bacterium]|nr:hypothetical protein [Planctomycetota bacterium]
MKLKLNRLTVGILLVVCVVLTMGALESGPGKYQIAAGEACVWLVDTESGKVWVSEKKVVETDQMWTANKPAKWYSYGSPGESGSQ